MRLSIGKIVPKLSQVSVLPNDAGRQNPEAFILCISISTYPRATETDVISLHTPFFPNSYCFWISQFCRFCRFDKQGYWLLVREVGAGAAKVDCNSCLWMCSCFKGNQVAVAETVRLEKLKAFTVWAFLESLATLCRSYVLLSLMLQCLSNCLQPGFLHVLYWAEERICTCKAKFKIHQAAGHGGLYF